MWFDSTLSHLDIYGKLCDREAYFERGICPLIVNRQAFLFSALSKSTLISFWLIVLSTHRFNESIAKETSSNFLLINAKSLISSSEIFPS